MIICHQISLAGVGRPDQSMVNFRELVSAALSLSAAGRHKNALGAVLVAHCVMADPAPAPAPATVPYSVVQAATRHYAQDTRDPVAGTINQELASRKILKLLRK